MGFATKDFHLLERASLLDAKGNQVRGGMDSERCQDCTVDDQLDQCSVQPNVHIRIVVGISMGLP